MQALSTESSAQIGYSQTSIKDPLLPLLTGDVSLSAEVYAFSDSRRYKQEVRLRTGMLSLVYNKPIC